MKHITCIFLRMSNHMPPDHAFTPVVTMIPGDGIGPEVVASAVTLVDAAGGRVSWEYADAGAEVFRRGIPSGVPEETIASIARTRVVLKGPLETPVGYGEKSANVTLRKLFETFANIRPVRELPGVPTPYSGRGIDLVVIRENVEDLYAGIEHMQTPDVAQCLKLISRLGCQRIARTALAFARSEGRTNVAVATKANIMKLTEGMLKSEFALAAADCPELDTWHVIIDNAAHQLVKAPEQFEVIVTTNMNGDILSDLTSALVGGLGFAPSANLGTEVAIFEAVHGSAPKYAGQDVANPCAVVLSAVMMLRHLEQFEAADALEQAVYRTLEDGIHTKDVKAGEPVGTAAFTEAVRARIGQASSIAPRQRQPLALPQISRSDARSEPGSRSKAGVDIFIESTDEPERIASRLQDATAGTPYHLKMVSCRGTVVWPSTGGSTGCIDHFRCRFVIADRHAWHQESVLDLLQRVGRIYRWMHVEKLEDIDGEPAYTKAQGEN
ncbi:MAG: NADP-dependent isocitrate dehydrogenase [Actinomycetales bacterium]|nr:NADP-dependent isocitrate dehydrogenase [Actinomycetales bacterium]